MVINLSLDPNIESAYRSSFDWARQSRMQEQGGPGLAFERISGCFLNFEAFIQSLESEVEACLNKSLAKLGLSTNINATLKQFESERVAAEYQILQSDGQNAILALNALAYILGKYATDTELGYTLSNFTKAVDHELRHHLDREFLVRTEQDRRYQSVDLESVNFEDFLSKTLIDARREGFAECDRYYNGPGFEWLLKRNALAAGKVLDFLKRIGHLNLKEGTTAELYAELCRFGTNDPIHVLWSNPVKDWVEFSPYKQGEVIMRTILYAETGELSPLPEKYIAALHKIKDLSSSDFYETYYRAVDKLGLNQEHTVFPKELTMQTLSS